MDKLHKNMPRLGLFLIGISALCATGCGDSSANVVEQPAAASRESGQISLAQKRRLLREAIPKLESRKLSCTVLSDQYLMENYGSPGDPGRRHCEKVARSRPTQHIRGYQIRALHSRKAKVFLVSSVGGKGLLHFVFESGNWLLDSVTFLQD